MKVTVTFTHERLALIDRWLNFIMNVDKMGREFDSSSLFEKYHSKRYPLKIVMN